MGALIDFVYDYSGVVRIGLDVGDLTTARVRFAGDLVYLHAGDSNKAQLLQLSGRYDKVEHWLRDAADEIAALSNGRYIHAVDPREPLSLVEQQAEQQDREGFDEPPSAA